jgi:uncharacterized protein (TIGR03435 family)
MNLRRRILSAFFLLLVVPVVAQAPAPPAKPAQPSPGKPAPKLAFDVATIKPAAPLDQAKLVADVQAGRMPKIGPQIGDSRATYSYMTLNQLIALAYNVRLYQISGPPWLSQERFDIEATFPEGATKDDAPAMLRSLLEERFKLAAHPAQEERKVLALTAGKSGPKMKESATAPQAFDPDSPLKPGERQIEGLDGPMRMKIDPDGTITINMGAKGTVIEKFDGQSQRLHLQSNGVTMAGFAQLLSNLFLQMGGANSRQVVDTTGLKGYYQVDLDLSLADLMATAHAQGTAMPAGPPSGGAGASAVPEASDPGGGSSVFESVRQMGLKLEDSKATVDRLIIDQIEKTPTEN